MLVVHVDMWKGISEEVVKKKIAGITNMISKFNKRNIKIFFHNIN